jgi:hypothetical protein
MTVSSFWAYKPWRTIPSNCRLAGTNRAIVALNGIGVGKIQKLEGS